MFNNLLKTALTAVPRQRVDFVAYAGRTADDLGRWATSYAQPVDAYGSFQAMGTKEAKENGFEVAGRYAKFLTDSDIKPVRRDGAPDKIVYDGVTYDVIDVDDWLAQDGWKRVYLVEGDAVAVVPPTPSCTITLTGAYAAAFGGSPADISGQTFSITSAGGAGSYVASTDLSAPTEISSGRRVAGLSAVSASAGTVTFLLLSSDAAKAVSATWSVSLSSWTFQTQSPAGVSSGFVAVAGAITDRIYLGVNADTGAGLLYRNGTPVSGGTIDTPLASIFSGKTQFALGGTGMPGAGQSFSGTILTNGADYVEGELPAGTLDWCGKEL